MKLKFSKLPAVINRLPIIGDLLCQSESVLAGLLGPVILWMTGYKQIKCGISAIWVPGNMKRTVMEGIEYLRDRDEEMFRRLTEKQRVFIFYSHDITMTNIYGYVYGLHESYVKRGAAWIAFFIMQSLVMSEASPSVNRFRLKDSERAALKAVPRKVMERMQQDSFDPDLIKSYKGMVQMWEQKEVFR